MMKLYVYDHCPYCVKARMIFGYKNIPFEMITLANDDEKTPIDLIDLKMVPILSVDGQNIPESLDIIEKVDAEHGPRFLSDEKMDGILQAWLNNAREFLYPLAMPRWINVGLEEFKTESAVAYFTKKKEDYIGSFKEHLQKTEDYIQAANAHLIKLDSMLSDSAFYSGDKASINDIHLYATLRSLSVVDGISYPKKVMFYMTMQEKLSKVPLHLNIAI
jgi:glutaredoxin 2